VSEQTRTEQLKIKCLLCVHCYLPDFWKLAITDDVCAKDIPQAEYNQSDDMSSVQSCSGHKLYNLLHHTRDIKGRYSELF